MNSINPSKKIKGFSPAYMVWVVGGMGPVKRHATMMSATDEAARLCRKECKTVYVLVETCRYVLGEAPIRIEEAAHDKA